MTSRTSFICILGFIFSVLLPFNSWAHWQTVGKADYNWGPFLVYTVSFYSENGAYQENQTPVMISFDYAKPVEGKNFAITLTKEMNALKIDKEKTAQWLKRLERALPDTSPNDRLSYIALSDKGYFVWNDQIIEPQFDADFNQAFLEIWLSGKSGFAHLTDKLLGKAESRTTETHPKQPESTTMQYDDASPQLPPSKQKNQYLPEFIHMS